MAVGNGGYGGFTAWKTMGQMARYGFAVVSTDTGHQSGQLDGSWALQQPETIIDWAWRALHTTAVLGKEITVAFYGQQIQYSYYTGCSTGGRQGLKEIQDFPDDFDGALIGAPAWWMNRLPVMVAWIGAQNLPENSTYHLDNTRLQFLKDEILRQCDAQDGVKDSVIMDPSICKFDYRQLLCTPTRNSTCLTPDQLQTVQSLLNDWTAPDGSLVYPAYTKGSDLSMLLSGTEQPFSLGADWIYDFLLNTTTYDWGNLDENMVQISEWINPGNSQASNFNMTRFQQKGGKLIHYHGLADQVIPTEGSRIFYEKVQAAHNKSGAGIDDFYRFFFIPGMYHCKSSDVAPWYIAGPEQAAAAGVLSGVPGHQDRYHDSVLALMAWTENNDAPEYLIASKFLDDNAEKGLKSQRPICPYPRRAKLIAGHIDDATSWRCI